MRRTDVRVYVIAGLAAIAAGLGYYRVTQPPDAGSRQMEAFFTAQEEMSVARVRSIVDTTALMFGAPRRYLARRNGSDSGRVVPESSIGVSAAFDELRLIRALTDSLRGAGWTTAATKNLKEKTTTIPIRDRDHTCVYRCILYRKELPLSLLKKN